jgi:hypothetical protein
MAFNTKKRKKSGDSILQDAETARSKAYKEGGTWDERETRASVVEEVADAAEQKKAAGDQLGADIATKALQALTQALELMESRIGKLEQPKTLNTKERLLKCPTCSQMMRSASGRGVCTGQHVQVMVAPNDFSLWPSYQGTVWNGITYAGRCTLPVTIAGSVKAEISRWEQREKKKFIPGGKMFGAGDFATGSTSLGGIPIL